MHHQCIFCFTDWIKSVNLPEQFEIYSVNDLNDVLCQFYLEAKTKGGEPLQLCTLIDVRDALRSYLSRISPSWSDIWCQYLHNFGTSNNVLETIREASKESTPKCKAPSKMPMTADDSKKLIQSGLLCTSNPLGLFRKVWFDLSLHLGCGGQAAMRSLTADMVVSETDENNRRYYRLNKCQKVDSARSNMEMQYWDWDARMYEIPGDPSCPVASMDLYLSKRNPFKNAFFQRPKPHYSKNEPWYESQLGHGVLASVMTRLSEEAGLSQSYTNTSIRVTAAEVLQKRSINIDDVMGFNPRNKNPRSIQLALTKTFTPAQLYFNSNTLHDIMYILPP